MKDKVILLPELSSTTGYGHFYRCVALAQMLRNSFELELYVNRQFKSLESGGVSKRLYDIEYPDLQFIEEYFNPESDVIVTDGYGIPLGLREGIKKLGFKTVRIDDFKSRVVEDLFVNQSSISSEEDYQFDKTKFLLGFDYVLLRDEYLKEAQKPANTASEKIEKVLLMFGGADPLNLGVKISQELLESSELKEIHLLGNYEKRSDSKLKYHGGLNASQLIDLIKEVDLVICAASTFFLEVACVGKACLLVAFGDDQLGLASHANSIGAAQFIGDFRKESPNIKLEINRALPKSSSMIDAQKKLIDGHQQSRILKAFNEL